MKKTLMIVLFLYTFMFTFSPQEIAAPTVMITVSKAVMEPLDAALAMLGSLEAGKVLKKRTHQPKER